MGTKSFDNYADLITFSRASSATYLDSDGLLKTVTTNTPRIEYDANGNRLGLLIEEQRTNLLTYSEDFTDSYWTKLAVTVSSSGTAPDGTTATKLSATATNSAHSVYVVPSVAPSTAYTGSVYVKAGEYTKVYFRSGSQNSAAATFDLVSGTVINTYGSPTSASITSTGNGWFRIQLTHTTGASNQNWAPNIIGYPDSGATIDVLTVSYLGDGYSGIYIWGAQLEAGAFPTSYIPTSGSTATRAADVASIDVDQFGYNHDESTFIAEASELGGLDSNTQRHTLFSTETASALRLYVGKSGGGGGSGDEIYVGEGASSTYFELGDITQNTFYKVGVVVKTNDISASLNGGAIVSDLSVALAKDETIIGIGSRTYSGTNVFNGHIKSLKYYPRRLSDDQLQELTQ